MVSIIPTIKPNKSLYHTMHTISPNEVIQLETFSHNHVILNMNVLLVNHKQFQVTKTLHLRI